MNWKVLCFGVLILPVLIGMGIWQLQRAAEKEEALASYTQQLQKSPGNWETLLATPLQYQQVQLTGAYQENNDWLLDNQIYKGQFGYRIYTPFCHADRCILVDRGWVKGNLDRQKLPVVTKVTGEVTILGRLDKISQNPAVGENEPLTTSPYRVEKIELDGIRVTEPGLPNVVSNSASHLASHLANHSVNHSTSSLKPTEGSVTGQQPEIIRSLVSWVLRLGDGQAGHYTVVWEPVVVGPEKHYGYAFQWFAMAVALIILLVFTILKNSKQAAS